MHLFRILALCTEPKVVFATMKSNWIRAWESTIRNGDSVTKMTFPYTACPFLRQTYKCSPKRWEWELTFANFVSATALTMLSHLIIFCLFRIITGKVKLTVTFYMRRNEKHILFDSLMFLITRKICIRYLRKEKERTLYDYVVFFFQFCYLDLTQLQMIWDSAFRKEIWNP